MSKNKFEVTVSGWFKLLAFIFFVGFSCVRIVPLSAAAGISALAYSLLFVFLAVNGSNSKVAAWFSNKNFFIAIFFMPTLVGAFYSGAIYFSSTEHATSNEVVLAAFGALLTILSIPFAAILLRVQGGIRRWNAFTAFVGFPISLFILCRIFPEKMAYAAGGATIIVFLIFFTFAVIQSIRDHKADDASGGDKGKYRGYVAKWDGKPNSDIHGKVICLRGTIIVEYSGEFDARRAEYAVQELVDSYLIRVKRDMKGYSVGSHDLTIRHNRID